MKARKTKKAVVTLLVLIGLFGFLGAATAGDLQPPAAPGSTMKTLDEVEPRIPISQADIPLTISTPGSYYLTEDVTAAGTAITVDVNDVTIDLAGYTLVGSGTEYGIYMSGRSNVEIRNGTVRDFSYGIYDGNSNSLGHRVIDIRSVFNGLRGIYLRGNSHMVKDCTVSNNGTSAAGNVYGIYVGSDSMVTGCIVYKNGATSTGSYVYGICASTGSTVTGNTAYYNGYMAPGYIYGISAASGSTVSGNTVRRNGYMASGNVYGISAASGSTVTGNTAYFNGATSTGSYVYGIRVFSGSTVTGNTAYYNGTTSTGTVYGIYLGQNNLADQNTAYGNNGTNMTLGVAGCVYGINVAP